MLCYGQGGNYSGGAVLWDRWFIPIWSDLTGMIAGNAMVAVGLCYNNLGQQVISEQQQIQEKLESWRDAEQASAILIRDSIQRLRPTVDSAKNGRAGRFTRNDVRADICQD